MSSSGQISLPTLLLGKSNRPTFGLPSLILHTLLSPYTVFRSFPLSLFPSKDMWPFLSPHGVGLLIGLWFARHSNRTPNYVDLESMQYRKYSTAPVFTCGFNALVGSDIS